MTSTVTIPNEALLAYGERAKRGEIHLLRLEVLSARKGYKLTFSDADYKTAAKATRHNAPQTR